MRFGGGQVFENVNVNVLSVPSMVYWASLRWCGRYVSYFPWNFLFSRGLLVTWQMRSMWNKFFHDRDNKGIMDKYYEMFGGNNSTNKKDFFNSPDNPEHSDQDSDGNGWTRLRRSWGLHEEEWLVWEKPVFHLLRLHGLSFIKISSEVWWVLCPRSSVLELSLITTNRCTQTQLIIKIPCTQLKYLNTHCNRGRFYP